MKKLIALCLFSASAAALTAAPAPAAKKAPSKTPAPAPKKAPAKTPASAKSAPQKPVVPEKKQPFELWMAAQTQALQCVAKKQYDEALKFFDQAEKEANRGIWKNYTLYEKAALLAQMGRASEALELLKKKVSRDRNTSYHRARCTLLRGKILMGAGRYDEAEKELKSFPDSTENNWISADITLALGKICEIRKDDEGARKYYRSVFNNTATLPGIRSRGLTAEVMMLKNRGQLKQALAYLDANKNIEQLPPDRILDLAFLRSELQIAMKDLKGARATLDEALRIPGKQAPWIASLHTRKAKISFMRKHYHEAQNLMRRARAVRGHDWGYDLEFHRQVDRIVAKINRERIQRERRARIAREKRARIERQRKARLERERKARLEKERKAKQNSEK